MDKEWYKVGNIIKRLQDNYKEDDLLLVAYWDKNYVTDVFEWNEIEKVTDDMWVEVVNKVNEYTDNVELTGSLIDSIAIEVAEKYSIGEE